MDIILAGGILKNDRGQVLLLHRNTISLKQWELPGGKVEANEEPEEAAVRELKEELGIDVSIIDCLGNAIFIEDEHIMNYYWYECEIAKGIPKIMEKKFDALKYWDIDNLIEIYDQLSQNMKNLLPILNKP